MGFLFAFIILSLLTIYLFIILKREEKVALCYHEYEDLGVNIYEPYHGPLRKLKCKKCGYITYTSINGEVDYDNL